MDFAAAPRFYSAVGRPFIAQVASFQAAFARGQRWSAQAQDKVFMNFFAGA